MAYTIVCRFGGENKATLERLNRIPLLWVLWKAVFPLFTLLCYRGAFMSVPVTEFLPFGFLDWLKVRP
jgi:hypothetical protein